MFENLDDPTPGSPATIDTVVERGRHLRTQRRMIVGAVAMFLIAGAITTAAALQKNGHAQVIVSNDSSSTTATTAPANDTTSTSAPATTTSIPTLGMCEAGALCPGSVSTTSSPTTPTTGQPWHDPHDLSLVSVSYPDTYGPSTCQYPWGATFPLSLIHI